MKRIDYKITWLYSTNIGIPQCIELLKYRCNTTRSRDFNPLVCDCEVLSQSQVLLIFRGYKLYGRMRKTKYLATFNLAGGLTEITLQFQSDILGMPPLTPVQEIDLFLQETIQARRRISQL